MYNIPYIHTVIYYIEVRQWIYLQTSGVLWKELYIAEFVNDS